MEVVYYTLIGISLYLVADWLLDRIETARGERFKYRSLIFFALILVMALTASQLIALFSRFAG